MVRNMPVFYMPTDDPHVNSALSNPVKLVFALDGSMDTSSTVPGFNHELR